CMVPPLILQPLVENAVAHGIANLTEGGWIRLNAEYAADASSVAIAVDNTFDPDAPARRKSGLGLANVRRRLNTRYGKNASFAIEKNGELFHVSLMLPAERQVVTA
ncbi:MAG TPA: GHKL domain-containing protein, partial [Terriglobales bacterium]|nr:GHKL domain-containing protein [Terriglobales bacterium]